MFDITKQEGNKRETENQNSSAQFLKTDRGKTKSNAIETPSIALPKGGGALKGIDEKFSVNTVNGTASFSIPLPFSPARGASPELGLSYNSGAGNGAFGLGWSLNLPSIKRKTDKKLPQYFDSIDSDTFLFSEAEDLVPEFEKDSYGSLLIDMDGNYIVKEKIINEITTDKSFTIRFYKPKIEGLFARIERWSDNKSPEIKWRVITKENITTLFGWSADSRIADPQDASKIFEWLPEFVLDDKGNCTRYIYKKEDNIGFNPSLLHNRNRTENGDITYTNLYLEKVLYGNKTPYKKFGDDFPGTSDYLFSTVFDYGTLNDKDTVDQINDWDFRADAFSDYKPGFEIRTTRLCKRVLLFHYFTELPGDSALVKSLNFEYDTSTEEDFSFLKSITTFGYIKQKHPDGTYTNKNLPPIEFEYQKHDWNKDIKSISPDALVHAPAGLDEPLYQFTDLFNEGLSGILTEQANGWYYKHNLGEGNFEQAKLVSPKPSFAGLGSRMQLLDMDADGGKQLVSLNTEPRGYFELSDENEWQPFQTFKNLPNIDLQDANTRLLDLNGDGKAEVVITEDHVFTWYESAGREGFNSVHQTLKPFDEEAGPHIVFSDPKQTVFLADMSGDGLIDIVRIRNGEVCYWPNLGYGKFGAKVGMDNAPVFAHPDSFNPSYLRLSDIDGSGTTDIIYLGKNKFICWKNLSGNRFSSTTFEIDAIPEIHNQSKITVTDLLGNGVACIVWSSNLAKDAQAPLKYIDLMNSKKPHIMVSYKNNLGKEVSLEYTPSTRFYIEDKLAGKPWVTKLHFPVHCISKTETRDMITGYCFVNSYKYHHGYYDHAEREFRGFGMVEQMDAEHFDHWIKGDAGNIVDKALHQEPILTKSWFHTGAFLSRENILNQFAHEYWYEEMARQGFDIVNHEVPLPDARLIAAPGLDAAIIEHLSAEEWREALRACKSMALRSEVFAKDAPLEEATLDQLKKELTPYSAATHNCVIELLQPKGNNEHAIFVVKESEAITYSYERDTTDPRIAHTLNIKLDQYGNVLESASVVYPRKITDASLPVETQDAQNRTTIMYTHNQFTNDAISADEYRLRLPSEVKTIELRGITKTNNLYSVSDFKDILKITNENKVVDAEYQQIDNEIPDGKYQRRLIEHIKTLYRSNDLINALPLHQLESQALPYENYQLAYTKVLLENIFGITNLPESKVNNNLMVEGKFTPEPDETNSENTNWWIRSGTMQFKEDTEPDLNAQNRFYTPISYTDPYDAVTKVKYDSSYYLFIKETEDALGNKAAVELFNFRTLSPQRMKDANDNISEAITDELGLVKAIAVLGKGNEADDLGGLFEYRTPEDDYLIESFLADNKVFTYNPVDSDVKKLLKMATARFVYDFDIYKTSGKPVVIASIVREEHFQKNNNSPVQLSFEYSNGLGKVVMKKVQAEPGKAKKVNVNTNDDTYSVSEIDTANLIRWIGNGRTVLNNKGNAVKQYEPYFSVTHRYEDLKELVETGVTPLMYYDAMGRLVKTELPDGTFSKTEFDSWKQAIYDQNDTVKESHWYADRGSPDPDNEPKPLNNPDRRAAWLAAKHADTPNVQHFDTLGRPVLQIENNGKDSGGNDILYKTKIELDIEGNLRKVTDARELTENGNKGNTVMQYKYDMLGNKVYQNSMDAGQRWLLTNILGNPLRTWDERNHEFQYFYDDLHRPTQSKVLRCDGDPLDNIFDRIFYGEEITTNGKTDKELNLRGQVYRHYDTGGLLEMPEYDFKGQPISTTRKLYENYKELANWTDANLDTTDIDLIPDLETESFTFITETDAFGRITRQTSPDGSIITPSYNEAGLLNGETVLHPGNSEETTYIQDIDYNEKGQRERIKYGNNVITTFSYDKETFRLIHLKSNRQSNDLLQDLYYTYDPVGNITHIEDQAIPTQFFSNMQIESVSEYTYDALYRLVEATGRENDSVLSFGNYDNWNDAPFMHQLNPDNPMVMRTYTQQYQYDKVGNIGQMKHIAGPDGSWTRNYEYESVNNRLKNTKVGQSFNYNYQHHPQHGYITAMPHLEEMDWNFKEELVKTIRQKVNLGNGIAETTYYQYDGQGQRIRKITENQADEGNTPTKKEERIYIAGYELYKKHSSPDKGLQRISLSLMDKQHRFVMIETRNDVDDGSEERLVRYQLHNHLGSACLELDSNAEVISYEEYHPYGTTAYQAKNATIKSAAKRYRYTGMERDEESGLEYHSARYYLPWLGRWLSADPIEIEDGVNLYKYGNNNPLLLLDKTGTQVDFNKMLELENKRFSGLDNTKTFVPNIENSEQIASYYVQRKLKKKKGKITTIADVTAKGIILKTDENLKTPGVSEMVAMIEEQHIYMLTCSENAIKNPDLLNPFSEKQELLGKTEITGKSDYITDTAIESANKFNMFVSNSTIFNVDESNANKLANYEAFVVNQLMQNFVSGSGAENYNFPTNGIISSKFLGSDLLYNAILYYTQTRKDVNKVQYHFGLKDLINDIARTKSVFASITGFVGSGTITIEQKKEGLQITIFNITSLTSGAFGKEAINEDYWPKSYVRVPGKTTPFGNISQTYNLFISNENIQLIYGFIR